MRDEGLSIPAPWQEFLGYENKDRVIRRNSRSSALVNERVIRGVSGGVFPHEAEGQVDNDVSRNRVGG